MHFRHISLFDAGLNNQKKQLTMFGPCCTLTLTVASHVTRHRLKHLISA